MGLFKSIGKAFKKIGGAIKKVAKPIISIGSKLALGGIGGTLLGKGIGLIAEKIKSIANRHKDQGEAATRQALDELNQTYPQYAAEIRNEAIRAGLGNIAGGGLMDILKNPIFMLGLVGMIFLMRK